MHSFIIAIATFTAYLLILTTRLTTLKSSSDYHVGIYIKVQDDVNCEDDGEVLMRLMVKIW